MFFFGFFRCASSDEDGPCSSQQSSSVHNTDLRWPSRKVESKYFLPPESGNVNKWAPFSPMYDLPTYKISSHQAASLAASSADQSSVLYGGTPFI
jgi:hypothetical protein